MKIQLLPLLLLIAALPTASGQLGISVSPTHSFARNWQVVAENYITHRRFDLFRHGTTCVIDYRYKFRNERLQIQPALLLMRTNSELELQAFQVSGIGLQGSIGIGLRPPSSKKRVYPYVQVSPGLALLSLRHDFADSATSPVNRLQQSTLVPNIGFSILAEIKLSDLLTVSPTVGGRCFPNVLWDGITERLSKSEGFNNYDLTHFWQYYFGLRIGLEFNQNKRPD